MSGLSQITVAVFSTTAMELDTTSIRFRYVYVKKAPQTCFARFCFLFLFRSRLFSRLQLIFYPALHTFQFRYTHPIFPPFFSSEDMLAGTIRWQRATSYGSGLCRAATLELNHVRLHKPIEGAHAAIRQRQRE